MHIANSGPFIQSNIAVKIESLIPKQQVTTASKILRSADSYLQRFIKFKEIAICHSYCEYLHLALLESDPKVNSFTPQPFSMRVGKRRYIPDCYYVKLGQRYTVEIKPRGEFREDLHIPLKDALSIKGIHFKVVSNEAILEHEVLALNWIKVIQTLISSEFEETDIEEIKIYEKLINNQEMTVGDIIDRGNRIENRHREIALFRLAHAGKVKLGLANHKINFDSEVSLCS